VRPRVGSPGPVGTGWRAAVVVVAAVAGVFALIGCGLSFLFELQGFGGPRDEPPRGAYLALMAGGAALGLAVPFVAAALVFRARRLLLGAGAALVAVVAIAVWMGVSA